MKRTSRHSNRWSREALRRAIFNSAHFSSIATDAQGVIQIFNVGAERMLGYAAADVVNQHTPAELSDSQELAARATALSVELGTPITQGFEAMTVKASLELEDIHELTYVRKDGSRVPAVESVTALRDGQHAIIGYLLISTDNTARKHAEEAQKTIEDALFSERERARITLNAIGDAVISTDVAGRVAYLNPRAEGVTGWSAADAIGRPLAEVFNIVDVTTRVSVDDPSALAMRLRATINLGTNCGLIRRDGSELLVEDSAAPIHDQNGRVTGAVIVFRDVTEARAISQRMAYSSRHDLLTNLPNRTLLDDRISQAVAIAKRSGTRMALLFVDLDRFKSVNDSLGHSVGDALLQSVAARLMACLRATDTISRWGGDEFVVLLSQLDAAETAAVSAAKILAAVSAPYAIADHVLHISASIGVGIWPDDARVGDQLIGAADAAMCQAKAHGGNNYQFFTSKLNDLAIARRSAEGSLRGALQRQELTLHYQPKNNLETSRMIGIEALVRWQHSTRGLLAPCEFVTIAEECGLILPIGRWVLREACRQARAWQEQGLTPMPIAVNVSALEFRSTGFVDGVAIVLDETGLAAQYLELEVTESILMDDTQSTSDVLHALKAMGVQIAIDDFGTGYSSLSYLSRFPIDTLKIDRSFVSGITQTGHDASIINAVIGLGCSLNQHVVAEGVETEQQLALLRRYLCVEGQGYYFSRPVGASQFADLLRQEIHGPQATPALA